MVSRNDDKNISPKNDHEGGSNKNGIRTFCKCAEAGSAGPSESAHISSNSSGSGSGNPSSSGKERSTETAVHAFLTDFAIGGVAGAITKTAVAPIERVKLLIQTQDVNPRVISGEVVRYKGMVDCFARVFNEQGALAFWRGNTANVMRYIPQQALNLSLKDFFRRNAPKYSSSSQPLRFFLVNLTCAGVAAAGALTICYPLDFARNRLASDVGSGRPTFTGIGDCITTTVRTSGIPGLYRGFSAGVGGVVVYRGMQLGTFDTIMGRNPYRNDEGWMGFVSGICAAQVAGLLSRPICYPFSTVRRRLQMESDKPRSERIYRSAFHCMKCILATEGLHGLYKGLMADIVRGMGSAFVLVGYDRLKLRFHKDFDDDYD